MEAAWKEYRFGDCVTLLSGGTPSKSRDDYWNGDLPWVSCKDMKVDRIYDAEDHLSALGAENGTRVVPEGTILLVVRGMILAKEFPVAIVKRCVAFNQDLKAVTCAHFVETEFLYYWLKANSHEILGRADEAGHGTKRIQTDRLLSLPIRVPSTLVQRRVAGILSVYDDLIENNQRRIKILEEMARSLYREWFVHFRFPGHDKVKMVSSPFGPIPQGWALTKVGSIFKTVLGGTPSRAKAEFWKNGTVPWINSGKVNELRIIEPSEFITEFALERSAAKLMPRGTTVLAITGATLGQVSYLEINSTANQSVVGIIDETGRLSEWLYLMFKERIHEIIQHASGGAQQHINKEIVSDVQILIPPTGLTDQFQHLVGPVFRQIATLMFKAQNLRCTRNLMLPRLLSGEMSNLYA